MMLEAHSSLTHTVLPVPVHWERGKTHNLSSPCKAGLRPHLVCCMSVSTIAGPLPCGHSHGASSASLPPSESGMLWVLWVLCGWGGAAGL